MRVTVLNGPNLNLLGTREPQLYGTTTLPELEAMMREEGARLGLSVQCIQSNHEGVLIDEIQRLPQTADGLILNAGAYSHTGVAIRDALSAVRVPFIGVHLTGVLSRQEYRRKLLFADLAVEVITGRRVEGYRLALRSLARHLSAR